MREIKFRAWETDSKTMLYEGWTGKPQFFVNMGVWQFTDREKLSPLHIMDKKASLLPMQYTGLKDKNGVEIYEGDIVVTWHLSRGYKYPNQKTRKVVEWREAKNCIGFNIGTGNNGGATLEVIGNIYENPELLNN